MAYANCIYRATGQTDVMLNVLHYYLIAKDNTFYMYACFTYTTFYIYYISNIYSSRLLIGIGLSYVYVFSAYFYKSKAFERYIFRTIDSAPISLTHIVKVMFLSNFQQVLAVACYMLKSEQKKICKNQDFIRKVTMKNLILNSLYTYFFV